MIYRVLFLVYEFEFPNNMNIYSIILIIYLKLISKGNDSYNRSRNNYPAPIKKDLWNNIEKNRNREIYRSPLKTIRSKQENY
jgi:hypothetical protein